MSLHKHAKFSLNNDKHIKKTINKKQQSINVKCHRLTEFEIDGNLFPEAGIDWTTLLEANREAVPNAEMQNSCIKNCCWEEVIFSCFLFCFPISMFFWRFFFFFVFDKVFFSTAKMWVCCLVVVLILIDCLSPNKSTNQQKNRQK